MSFDAKAFVRNLRYDLGRQFSGRVHHHGPTDALSEALLERVRGVSGERLLDGYLPPALTEAVLEVCVQSAQAAYTLGEDDGVDRGRGDTIDRLAERFAVDISTTMADSEIPASAYRLAEDFVAFRDARRAKKTTTP